MDRLDEMEAPELRELLRNLIASAEKKRTDPQNSSMWLWLTQVAKICNDSGIDMVLFLEKLNGEAEIPVTKNSLHERFWKPILKHMTNKESTTQMDTKEPDVIYQTACRILSNSLGVTPPPWPDRFRDE